MFFFLLFLIWISYKWQTFIKFTKLNSWQKISYVFFDNFPIISLVWHESQTQHLSCSIHKYTSGLVLTYDIHNTLNGYIFTTLSEFNMTMTRHSQKRVIRHPIRLHDLSIHTLPYYSSLAHVYEAAIDVDTTHSEYTQSTPHCVFVLASIAIWHIPEASEAWVDRQPFALTQRGLWLLIVVFRRPFHTLTVCAWWNDSMKCDGKCSAVLMMCS